MSLATIAAGTTGLGAAAFAVVGSLGPDDDYRSRNAPLSFDLWNLKVGQIEQLIFERHILFVRHLTEKQQQTIGLDLLRNTSIRNQNSATEASAQIPNRTFGPNDEYVIHSGHCTYKFNIVLTEYNDGWICPHCGSQYDLIGRVRKGPARKDLPIPEFDFDERLQLAVYSEEQGAIRRGVRRFSPGGS